MEQFVICVEQDGALVPLMIDGGTIKPAKRSEDITILDKAKADLIVVQYFPSGVVVSLDEVA